MKIAISAETTIDMPKDLLEKFDIKTVPFTVIMGEEEFLDGEINNEQIFEFVERTKKLPKTSAVNKFQYEQHFNNLKQNYDAIIHFTLSSEMSSAYQNASEVAKNIDNVFIIDSRSLSTGIALLAIKAREMAQNGESLENIINLITKLRGKVQASFILNKLNYLAKGGRCSALTCFGANMLMIKPQIIVKDGKMKVGKKYIGSLESATKKYCEDILNAFSGYDLEHAFVTRTTATNGMIETATKALKKRGFKNIHYTNAGGTITSHCGPYTLGILFISK